MVSLIKTSLYIEPKIIRLLTGRTSVTTEEQGTAPIYLDHPWHVSTETHPQRITGLQVRL